MIQRQLNTDNYPIYFSGSPNLSVSKNGSPFAVASGSIVEIGSGYCYLNGNPFDRDIIGDSLYFPLSGIPFTVTIVNFNPFVSQTSVACLELTGVPSETGSINDMMRWMYVQSRNELVDNDTVQQIYVKNDSGNIIGQADRSSSRGVFTRGKFITI